MKKKKYEINFHIPGILAIITCIVGLIGLYNWAGLPHKYTSFLTFTLVFMAYFFIASLGFIQLADMMGWLERWKDKLNGK